MDTQLNMSTSVQEPLEQQTEKLRPNLILGICCLSLLLVSMDATIVNVGLPSIRRDLRASISELQWIIDAYTLVVASLLMFAGSMADRFGRKKIFQAGMALFMFGSLLCSLATGIKTLIAARVVQAIGATMLNPVAMSIITNTFVDPKARARAIGVWGAVAGVSMALGPLIGGGLTQTIGWRSMFWINLPIGIVGLILAALFIPESKAAKTRRIDPIGQLLVFASLASLVYAVIEGPHAGWQSPLILSLFGLFLFSVVSIVLYETRRKEPLLDVRFFRSFPFSSATVIAVCGFSALSGFLFLNAIYLQEVRGMSAFHTGLCTLPLAAAAIICSPISGRMVGNYGTRPSLLLAGAGTMLSAYMLTYLDTSIPIWFLMIAYFVFGTGFGLVNAPITNTAVSGMPKAQAGLAAAVASTSRQVGASLGVAVAGTIAKAHTTTGAGFAQATHAVWWIIVASGATIILLGIISNTEWANGTRRHAAHLLEENE